MASINPTRINLINTKKSIRIAQKGRDLLKRKREVLVLEFMRLLKLSGADRSYLDQLLYKAYQIIAISSAYVGDFELNYAAMHSEAIAAIFTMASYVYSFPIWISYVLILVVSPLFFYAPSSIVIDDNKAHNAMKKSAAFFIKRPDYFVLWLVVAIVLLTVLDFVFIAIGGPLYAGYLSLIVDSFFVLPFLIILQSESYVKRFALLKN